MKKILLLLSCALLCSCSGNENTGGNKNDEEQNFSLGADISWVTEMEARGHKFYNASGEERDCFELMKELGLDAVRLRVWVDPSAHGDWCNTDDMVAKARRAADQGLKVMVDFHYSDWWADPGQQHKPEAWKGLGLEELKEAYVAHTVDVLNALKTVGVAPAWVQVGNEIRPGMLWDEDASLSCASYDIRNCDIKDWDDRSETVRFRENWKNLADFISLGYDAVKSVFPAAEVIVHLDNGYDNELFDWFFGKLRAGGGKWDMIGMSLYPFWSSAEGTSEELIARCISNINKLAAKYGSDVMMVETGMECADNMGNLASDEVLQKGKTDLELLVRECFTKTKGRCKGVFYWEPQCRPAQYRLGAFTEDGHPTVIMDAFKTALD